MFHQRRIVMLANPRFGYLSPSWKVREALEAAGHAVFWFTPDRWPQLFSSELVDPSPLAALCGRWKADALVAADGIALDAAPRPAGTAYVTLAQTDDELERSMRRGSGTPERAWLLPRVDASRLEDERTVVSRLDGRIDATARVPANTIAFGPGIVCAQDATEARVTALRGLERAVDDVPIRCLGAGWPEEWSFNRTTSDALYACAAGGALLAFPDDGGARDAAAGDYFARAFEQLSGCTVIRANDCADPSELGGIVERALRSSSKPAVKQPTEDPFAASVLRALDEACEGRCPEGTCGCSDPCRLVSLFGYVGKGNFGDEYLLSTVAERVSARVDGAVSVAVSEDPWHTLVHHGIYAISLGDKSALDGLLARCSTALAIGGLLFDQGVRWTMGKAELLSSVLHSDLPGIAAYASLASLNHVPVVYYGIGGGPLELEHSRRLVELMGNLGGTFLCRDAETARLVRAAGVPSRQVLQRADVALTGGACPCDDVDAWLREEGIPDTEEFFVVSLRDYEGLPGDFPARVARACDGVLDPQDGMHVVFCLLDEADRAISERVISKMNQAARAHVFSYGERVDAMVDLLARACAGLSMRYHCSLLLFKSGTPCVGLGYLPKVCSLYEEAGMGAYLLPVDVGTEGLEGALSSLVEGRSALRPVVERGVLSLMELAQAEEDDLIELVASSEPVARRRAAHEETYLYEMPFADRELRDARAECRDVKAWLNNMEGWLADANARLADARDELDAARVRAGELEGELAEARRRVVELESSNSYKVGSLLMKVPGKIKHAIKR